MTMLRLTDAGRTAMADGNNRALNAIQLRSLQIGDGLGPGGEADDARAALRSERNSAALTGTTMAAARLAVRATVMPTDAYSVTEAGIIARIGDAGVEFLLAYWAVPTAGDALATTVADISLIVAGVLDIRNSAAEVNVTVAVNITFGGPGVFVELSDVPDYISAAEYLKGNNTGTALVWDEAPPVVATEGDLPAPAAAVNSTYKVTSFGATARPALALKRNNAWRYLQPAENLIPSGTRMVFYQAAAPTGWTKVTNVNDRLLRVVSGAGGSVGGSWDITGITIGSTALSIDQIPAHGHGNGSLRAASGGSHAHGLYSETEFGAGVGKTGIDAGNANTVGTPRTKSSGSHSHSITGSTSAAGSGHAHGHAINSGGTWRPAYADVIICSRDA